MRLRIDSDLPGIPPGIAAKPFRLFLIPSQVQINKPLNPPVPEQTVQIEMREHTDAFPHGSINHNLQVLFAEMTVYRIIEREKCIGFQHIAGHWILLSSKIAFFPDPLFIQRHCPFPAFLSLFGRIMLRQPGLHRRFKDFQILVHVYSSLLFFSHIPALKDTTTGNKAQTADSCIRKAGAFISACSGHSLSCYVSDNS